MVRTTTERGFEKITFNDRYNKQCYIQNSSLAEEAAIWLGIEDPEPRIMAVDAKKLGIPTNETRGWIPFNIPEEVLVTTQMHISQKQAKDLIKVLQNFVDKGTI